MQKRTEKTKKNMKTGYGIENWLEATTMESRRIAEEEMFYCIRFKKRHVS